MFGIDMLTAVSYNTGMSKKADWQVEPLYKALLGAVKKKRNLATVARESKVPYESLRQFKTTGSLGDDYRAQLWSYCEKLAGELDIEYWGDFDLPNPESVSDPLTQAVLRLLLVSKSCLKTEMPKTDKAAMLRDEFRLIERRLLPNVKD